MRNLMLALLCATALSACESSDSVSSLSPVMNSAPVISAGGDASYAEGTSVTLLASLGDTEGDSTLTWSQLSGTAVTLSDVNALRPSFTVPLVSTDTDLVFRITASDDVNPADSDEVTITIENLEDRTYDGTDNNKSNFDWGSAPRHLERLGDVAYDDGISTMAGASRPSARLISNIVVNQDEGTFLPNSFGGTDYVWQWGQFVDHDIGITEGDQESENIIVPTGDMFFDPSSTGTAVITFDRAIFDPATGTDVTNPREQENEITAWIDGSQVYGHEDGRALALRVSADSPYLATSAGNLMPFNTSGQANAAAFVTDPTTLFLGGDIRANEQVGLAVMHTLFVREHNRLAAIIEAENPSASGEEVFQATRRLVVAILQKITYDEFLPALLGSDGIPAYTGYDASMNPGLFNEFSGAAFRLGHSMLNEQLLRLDASGNEIAGGHLSLRNSFFTAPSILTQEDDLDPILRGLAAQEHQTLDAKVITDIRNFLFGAPGMGGFDLASLNIQRGRDLGLPSYNDMREVMGLARVTSFADITADTDAQTNLFTAYGDVDEIDLWVGGLSEDAIGTNGAQLGPLFDAIMKRQFTALRDGDRFWYENDLTPEELSRIEDVTLASVIRANTNIGAELQDNVFAIAP